MHHEGETYSPVYQEATRQNYSELERLYGIVDAKERAGVFVSHHPHELDFHSRRALYGWFNRWLGVPSARVDEAAFDEAPASVLNCTPTGQVLASLRGRSVARVIGME